MENRHWKYICTHTFVFMNIYEWQLEMLNCHIHLTLLVHFFFFSSFCFFFSLYLRSVLPLELNLLVRWLLKTLCIPLRMEKSNRERRRKKYINRAKCFTHVKSEKGKDTALKQVDFVKLFTKLQCLQGNNKSFKVYLHWLLRIWSSCIPLLFPFHFLIHGKLPCIYVCVCVCVKSNLFSNFSTLHK